MKNIAYGVYRCVIEYRSDGVFIYNKANYYTHIDVMNAREQGLKTTIIDDDQVNCLSCANKLTKSNCLFGRFVDVDMMFDV